MADAVRLISQTSQSSGSYPGISRVKARVDGWQLCRFVADAVRLTRHDTVTVEVADPEGAEASEESQGEGSLMDNIVSTSQAAESQGSSTTSLLDSVEGKTRVSGSDCIERPTGGKGGSYSTRSFFTGASARYSPEPLLPCWGGKILWPICRHAGRGEGRRPADGGREAGQCVQRGGRCSCQVSC